jgi:hypothetical protein
MISSPEEARLLLNKWTNESARIVAFLSSFPSPPADFVVRLEGKFTKVEPETGTVLFESEEDFMMFRLNDAIEYRESFDHSANLPQVLARERTKWTAALCLTYKSSTLVFCTHEEPQHAI